MSTLDSLRDQQSPSQITPADVPTGEPSLVELVERAPAGKHRRIRIATVFASIYISGEPSRMLHILENLDRERFDHFLLTIAKPNDGERAHGTARQRYKDAGIELLDLGEDRWSAGVLRLSPLALFGGIWKLARTVWKLAKFLRQNQIDILDVHSESPMLIGALAGRLARVPVIIATAYFPDFWDRPIWRSLGRFAFRSADVFITDSFAQRDEINRWLGRPLRRSVVLKNGVVPPHPTRQAIEVCEELGIQQDANVKIVGQISRMEPRKGQVVLLHAARLVIDAVPNTKFLLCGFVSPWCPEDYQEHLRALSRDLGIEKHVTIFSYPGEIGDIWQLIDVQAHASMMDSSPMSVIEGMSLGKPVVVTDEGGIPELILNEQTGIVVPQGNAEALAHGLIRILSDGALAQRFAAATHQRYRELHDPATTTRQLEDIFVQALLEKQPSMESCNG
jgi:L-malate glycosyltransferase